MSKAEDTRARILDAAENVVLRDGVAHLTLDATAAEAGLSKGGVLYHFPSRDALVAGMVTRLIDGFNDDLAARQADDRGPGAFTRAYVEASFAPLPGGSDAREIRLGAALIAAAAAEPALLQPLQDDFARMQELVEDDGIDPARATLVRLAADGLWLADLFGLAPLDAALRAQVVAELEVLCRPTPAERRAARAALASS
jgi:AcrR family transcriptional regulator